MFSFSSFFFSFFSISSKKENKIIEKKMKAGYWKEYWHDVWFFPWKLAQEATLCICRLETGTSGLITTTGFLRTCEARKVPGLPGKYSHRSTWIIQETPGNIPNPERKIYGCFSKRAFEKWTASLISQCQTILCTETTKPEECLYGVHSTRS